MKEFKIALIPGDGVGPEVVDSAREVVEVAARKGDVRFQFTEYMAGRIAYDRTKDALPAETLDGIRRSDAALLGGLSSELIPPPSPVGRLRKELGLYAEACPIRSFAGVWCLWETIDLIIVREITQGFLADRNLYKGHGEFMPDEDTVLSLRVLTRKASERIAGFAFDYASRLSRKKITVAHKANVLRMGDNFFLDICKSVAGNYPGIELKDEYVDSVARNLISRPETYDVLLTTNLFGDILLDEAAALVRSLVPTANFGKDCAVFKPVHETMPDLAGKNVISPIPAILSAAMMAEYLGASAVPASIRKAVREVLAEGSTRTRDLGGSATTTEMTQAIVEALLKED
jgi:isocitrate/isopropylmalate dehydrogenase